MFLETKCAGIILNVPWSLGCVADMSPVAFFSPTATFSSALFWDSKLGPMSLSLFILVFLLCDRLSLLATNHRDSVVSTPGDSAFYITFTAQMIIVFPVLPSSLTIFIFFPFGWWCHYLLCILSPGLLCTGFSNLTHEVCKHLGILGDS